MDEKVCAVVCVDGITRAVIKGYTPDISWSAYVHWLRQRRPCLQVLHLRQPYDWLDIISGPTDQYNRLERAMMHDLINGLDGDVKRIVLLGFSLGGLTTLMLAHEISRALKDIPLEYAAYVSLGTPFAGTGRPQDVILRRAHYSYFAHMFDTAATYRMFTSILGLGDQLQLRMLIGEIKHDEIVSASSSLHPVHWLSGRKLPPGVKWGTFQIECGHPLRAHDGLLNDQLAISYIDGLVDGLLPAKEPIEYTPFYPHPA